MTIDVKAISELQGAYCVRNERKGDVGDFVVLGGLDYREVDGQTEPFLTVRAAAFGQRPEGWEVDVPIVEPRTFFEEYRLATDKEISTWRTAETARIQKMKPEPREPTPREMTLALIAALEENTAALRAAAK